MIKRRGPAQATQLTSLKESWSEGWVFGWVWAKDPAEQTRHPRQTENHTYRLETLGRAILTDLGPKEEKQMVQCHVPLIVEKASNSCQPGQGAKGQWPQPHPGQGWALELPGQGSGLNVG